MREHALPQDVTGYKFHIIGNMTLKQFGEVAAGCIIAFIIYSTNLPDLVKWPLVIGFAGLGAALAFLPIGERPMDQWLLVFFRALYRPTHFYWKRTSKVPDAFAYQPRSDAKSMVGEVDLSPVRRQRVKEYLRSINTPKPKDMIEEYEGQRINEVLGVFSGGGGASSTSMYQSTSSGLSGKISTSLENFSQLFTPPAQPAVATVNVDTAENMPVMTEQGLPEVSLPSYSPTDINQQFYAQEVATVAAQLEQQLPEATTSVEFATPTNQATAPAALGLGGAVYVDTVQQDSPDTSERVSSSSVVASTPVSVPQTAQIEIEPSASIDAALDNTASQTPPTEQLDTFIEPVSPMQLSTVFDDAPITPAAPVAATPANIKLPFPETPTEPNKVVGIVTDPQMNPLSNTIVEILTPEGLPARAVKTNMLGQFFITTPLTAGTYVIHAEKDGMQFPNQQLLIQDQIVQPIELRATS